MTRLLLAALVLAALATWKLRRDAARFAAGEMSDQWVTSRPRLHTLYVRPVDHVAWDAIQRRAGG